MLTAMPHIAAMQAYPLADLTQDLAADFVSLAQNESLRGPSPQAIEAAVARLQKPHLYPDPDALALKQAISDVYAVSARDLVIGAGSLDLIAAIARSFSGPGRAVLASAHCYPFFRTAAAMAGARFDIAPEKSLTVDVPSLLKAVRDDTAIVFVANPANPTGTRISLRDILTLRSGLPENVLLVIDEAYGEFADHLGERHFDLPKQGNTVVLRSFSKAYGLAGLRVGWGVFPPQVNTEVRKVLNPNAVSVAAQDAACAAVLDQDYMRTTCAMTQEALAKTARHLNGLAIDVTSSHTNFLLLDLGSPDRARHLDMALQAQGIILRGQAGAGLPQALRMTVGPDEVMVRVLSAFEQIAGEGGI